MRLATIESPSGPRTALIDGDRALDLVAASDRHRTDGLNGALSNGLRTLIAAGEPALDALRELATRAADDDDLWLQEQDARYLPPILDPPRIMCLGRNYAEHAREGRAEVPGMPMLFLKPASAMTGHRSPVVIADSTDQVDWEGELGVVIGLGGRAIEEADAMKHIGGYVVANDVTARDWQRRTSQFDSGKMFDTFAPVGPWLVTPDEVGEPDTLAVTTKVNDVVMQKGNTADMVFPIAYLISYLSRAVRLLPGDIILTGTPSGVGYARTPPVFLQNGDVVEVGISGVGTLINPVRSAAEYLRENPDW